MQFIEDPLFMSPNKDTYPPFKNGLYMEEFFLEFVKQNRLVFDKMGRQYIPVLWTNFQIEDWFESRKDEMQIILDKYIKENPCENGYFTVVQYDDGPKLILPENTIIYGACTGNIPLPLIYEDRERKLIQDVVIKNYHDKSILCSFVGTFTHDVRNKIYYYFKDSSLVKLYMRRYWSAVVEKDNQDLFRDITIDSKFALAPRGYGRSSFRFFEIFQLGAIPIYIWDDIEWLPYKDIIDYSKICISIHIDHLDQLENILLSIDEIKYNEMMENYRKIAYMFELEFMCNYIMGSIDHLVHY